MASLESTEGTVQFRHSSLPGGSAETWYRIVGNLQPDSTPLVLLHGGPGIPSIIFSDVFDKYAAQSGNPLIVYDQVGCGKSTHFQQTRLDTSLWTPKLFVDELENLLGKLGVTTFDLYGHSWGALLAAQVASTDRPFVRHLRRLILASGLSCSSQWEVAQRALLKQMPQSVQDAIEKGERERDYQSAAYQEAINAYYQQFVCRTSPWPEALNNAFAEAGKDDTVYFTMWGPSEVTVTGGLKDYDLRPQLHKIKAPTLLINGEYDEATDEVMRPFFTNIEKVKWVVMSNVAHVAYLEQPEKYISIVADFLT
ncbi:L-amino acid amidase [Trichoderma asperellum]|uniref:L-amino acid amidase n=1 Tax=Trichoderma asperellum TaxID=101201 RepID=A0A6V8R0X3_TRIAP|nr:L-amino acid amidase [Trichoderma asperellum]